MGVQVKAGLIAVGVIVLMVGGYFVLTPPPPFIIVSPEIIWHTGIDIPVIGEFNITNTMFTSWIMVVVLVIAAVFVRKGVSIVPRGFSGVVEAAGMAFYGFIEQAAGPENARKFFPLVATIFFFILVSNYSGLLPVFNVIGRTEPGHGGNSMVHFEEAKIAGFEITYIPLKAEKVDLNHDHDGHGDSRAGSLETVSRDATGSATTLANAAGAEGVSYGVIAPALRSVMSDMNAPLAIAIYSFIFVEIWGLQALGVSYLKKFFAWDFYKKGGFGVIDIFVGILEFVSELSRIVSFTFRLFGNIFAGEVLLLMMTFLVPFLLTDVFYLLELFVGLVQAFVFAMLTTVFAATAVTAHGDHDDEHDEEHVQHQQEAVPA